MKTINKHALIVFLTLTVLSGAFASVTHKIPYLCLIFIFGALTYLAFKDYKNI